MSDDKVVPFSNKVPYNEGKVKCVSCGHEWEASVPAPDPLIYMECPECGCEGGMKQGLVDLPDKALWYCGECDNTVFEIYQEHGAFCINCGQVQSW